MIWPFKKKKEFLVTVVRARETLSKDTTTDLNNVMTEFGIHFYPLRGIGVLPGTTLIFSHRALTHNELQATEAKLMQLELQAVEPQHRA